MELQTHEISRYNRLINFSAGPSTLAIPVLEKIQQDLFNWHGKGLSVLEMSHRSKEFDSIIKESEENLRKLMNIPDNYYVIFTQSGGTGAFSHVVLNLAPEETDKVSYVVSGIWSKKAFDEASRHANVEILYDGRNDNFRNIGKLEQPDPKSKYVYFCSNETVNGIETLDLELEDNPNRILVTDMSSNFLSRAIDVKKYGLIFAGAQKNAGIAGLTIYIVRKDLLGNPRSSIPGFMNLKVLGENRSLINTPPCFSIYVSGLVLKWILDLGGIEKMEEYNIKKAQILYDYIDRSNYYVNHVDKKYRSRMNIPFSIMGEKHQELEKMFVEQAEANGIISIKGHSSVGGLRASIYNAMKIEFIEKLIDFMKNFRDQNPF